MPVEGAQELHADKDDASGDVPSTPSAPSPPQLGGVTSGSPENEGSDSVGGAKVPQLGGESQGLAPVADEVPQPGGESQHPAPVADEAQGDNADLPTSAAPLPPVQVCVRLRPLLAWEKEAGHASSALDVTPGANGVVSLRPREGGEESARVRSFRFDAVLSPDQSQQDVWELAHAERLIDKVVAGFHATVFAYGQTGTGKTHTMEGYTYNHHNGSAAPSADAGRARVRVSATPPEQLGLVPRMVTTLFARADALRAKMVAEGKVAESVTVKVSFLQIYKERVYDLLNPVHTLAKQEVGKGEEVAGLRMRWHPIRRQFFVENLFEFDCNTADELLEHYGTGIRNKHVASTAMNVASSRSHTVLMVTLVRRTGLSETSDVSAVRSVVSKLALVDLAGSERASASSGCDRSAVRFQEAVNINQSLFVLRKVITALSKWQEGDDRAVHVPYRESKLTSLLQHSIGGNSFLLMLACLSPSDKHHEENLSTLQYASQAANIKNVPTVNLDPKDRLIQQLRAQLDAAHSYILQTLGVEELPQELLEASGSNARRQLQQRSYRRRVRSTEGDAFRATFSGPVQTCSRTVGWPRAQDTPASSSSRTSAAERPLTSEVAVREASRLSGAAPSPSPFGRSGSELRREPSLQSRAHQEEGRSLFSAADAMLANYSGGGGSVNTNLPTPRGGAEAMPHSSGPPLPQPLPQVQQAPHTARTPRGGGRERGHGQMRPPSLPPAAGSLPPIPADASRRRSNNDSGSSPASRAEAPAPSRSGGPSRAVSRTRPRYCDEPGQKGQRRLHATPVASGEPQAEAVTPSPITRSTTMSTTATSSLSSDPPPPPGSGGGGVRTSDAEIAAQRYLESGLWDALEELRQNKSDLEAQLAGSRAREQELRARLLDLDVSPTPRAASGAASQVAAALLPEATAAASDPAVAASAVDSTERSVVAEAVASAAAAVAEAVTDADREKATLRAENERLRLDAQNLQDRLEIFYGAMELAGDVPGTLGETASLVSGAVLSELAGPGGGIAERVERFHSKLVLEAANLRNEVAALKKKKWILRTVLANGGESERRAIDEEVEVLRRSKREAAIVTAES